MADRRRNHAQAPHARTALEYPSIKTLVEELVGTLSKSVDIGFQPENSPVRNFLKRRGFFFQFGRPLPKLARAR
jgi:hypothetical protein